MAARPVAVLTLLSCLAAGCAGGDSADPAEPLSSRSDPTSAVDGTEHQDRSTGGDKTSVPVLPDVASDETLRGAKAFVGYYIDLLNYAANTGDIAKMSAVAQGCDGCRSYEDLYESTYDHGGYMKEPGWRTSEIFAAVQGDGSTGVLVTVKAPRMRYRLSNDSQEKIGRRDVYKLRFEVDRRSGKWVVTFFGLQTEADDL